MSSGAVMLGEGQGRNFETRDTRLVSALMAVGVRPVGKEPVHIVTRADRPGEKFQYVLEPLSGDGRYVTQELVDGWREGVEWIARNPEHPFAYAMAALKNHYSLLDYVKGAVRQVFLQRGRSVAMLPMNASARLEEEILGRLE